MLENISLLQMAPVLNVQLLLSGIFIGAVYALAAYGLGLVWGVTSVKNLAQGDFVMIGGYLGWYVATTWHIHPLYTLPIVCVFMFALGWVLYLLIIRRVIGHDLFNSLLATFGIALVGQQLLNVLFGPEVQTANAGFGSMMLFGGAVTIGWIKVVSFGVCIVLGGGLVTFMKKSRMGQAIRATAQDARAAKVMGIDTDKVYAFTFSLNAAICGAAGVLIAMTWVIQPFYGIPYAIRAFVIVTAAGIGNLPGVIVASLGLGVIEQYAGFVLGAQFQQATVVGLLVLVLIWRQIVMSRHRLAVE